MIEHPSRLAHLRAHTRAVHERLETVPSLARLSAPELDRTEYTGILVAILAFHSTVEPAIAAALAGMPQARALLDDRRPSALREDIAFLHGSPGLARPDFPPPASAGSALGALYVIEGGNLGGRVIARRLAVSLGVSPGKGGSFYGGLSAEMARRQWAALCLVLEDPGTEIALEELAEGACRTFACLEQWMRLLSAPLFHCAYKTK